MIPYGRQSIGNDDVKAVTEVLTSGWLTQGPAVPRFEEALCTATGAAHAVAVTNATSALHMSCLALGLGPGDTGWTVPNTFVASANCILYCGADIDFVDIDPATRNMSVTALEAKLEKAKREGKLPKVVIPVHFAGHSCDMAAIGALAKEFGFKVIEDASHAIGGAYEGKPVGDCRYSEITIFSFHPVKIVTTGEGGAALTQDATIADRLRLLRSHGITREHRALTPASAGDWYYEQQVLGFNFRMTDPPRASVRRPWRVLLHGPPVLRLRLPRSRPHRDARQIEHSPRAMAGKAVRPSRAGRSARRVPRVLR